MITLTTPLQITSVIGSSTTIGYNKLRVVQILSDPLTLTINASVQILVSNTPTAPIIDGTLSIVATGGSPQAILTIPNIDSFASVSLAGANLTTVQGWITSLQNSIENGLVSVALVAGTQSSGV